STHVKSHGWYVLQRAAAPSRRRGSRSGKRRLDLRWSRCAVSEPRPDGVHHYGASRFVEAEMMRENLLQKQVRIVTRGISRSWHTRCNIAFDQSRKLLGWFPAGPGR